MAKIPFYCAIKDSSDNKSSAFESQIHTHAHTRAHTPKIENYLARINEVSIYILLCLFEIRKSYFVL